jgi:hypothetical protein
MTIHATILTAIVLTLLSVFPSPSLAEEYSSDSVMPEKRSFVKYARLEMASIHPAAAAPIPVRLTSRISFPLFLAVFLISVACTGYIWRVRNHAAIDPNSSLDGDAN